MYKGFFETFDLEKYDYQVLMRDIYYPYDFIVLVGEIKRKNELVAYIKDLKSEFKVKPIKKSITPEIVLKLEEILLKQEPKRTSKFIEYSINTYGEYVIRFRNTINFYPDVKVGKTRKDALLALCTQLQDGIQDQVKAVFNNVG
jgi:hypothetical protein